MTYIGCDVLEPDPEPPFRRPVRQVATPEQLKTCVDNLQRWYEDAKAAAPPTA